MSANAKLWRPISLDLPSHTTHRSLLGRRNIGLDAGIDDAARSMKGVDTLRVTDVKVENAERT
jgi:hypothetical protein